MNAVPTKPQFDPKYVRSLAEAENQLLQVLVDEFKIIRKGQGFELQVAINENSPTIWLREAKRELHAGLRRKRRIAVQRKIDEFVASDREALDYRDPSFPFRLGNSGTLPIVRMKRTKHEKNRKGAKDTNDMEATDYYCLFYRDSQPTGWNIANGGANTRHDILHPDAVVERELREELIVVEPIRGLWYVFDWHEARLHDHPDFALAQALWMERFRRQGFTKFENISLPLKWSLPPDVDYEGLDERQHDAIRILFGGTDPYYTGQGFLNINAEDFGIEFDRIAKLTVNDEAILCDGELRGHELLNRVVGLFPVERVLKEVKAGRRHFEPERIYWNGVDRTADDTKEVVEAYLASRTSSWAQLEKSLRRQAAPDPPGDPFDLCPVTRTIIERHGKIRGAVPRQPAPFDVFLSFASEDDSLARNVFEHLHNRAGHRVFFSDLTQTRGGFADQIDHALDVARSFVVVGTHLDHLNKSWVKYEWRNFHNDMKSKRKPEDAPFFALVKGINPPDLPRPLREQSAVRIDDLGLETALAQTAKRLSVP